MLVARSSTNIHVNVKLNLLSYLITKIVCNKIGLLKITLFDFY